MSSFKFIILSAFLFGVSLWPAMVISTLPAPLSGEPLIEKGCHGVGHYAARCIKTLQHAPDSEKANGTILALYALRFVEDHVANYSAELKSATNNEMYPLLQSTISDCLDQYNPLDDLITSAINALSTKTYTEATKFIGAAIDGTYVCDSGFKTNFPEDNKVAVVPKDFQLARHLRGRNVFTKNMLAAAKNLLT